MKKYILSLVFSALIMSCANQKPVGKTEAEVLYKEAKQLVEDNRYLLATEKLNAIKNQYPYSFYATPAELLQAEIYFKQESFVEAAAAFMLFKDFHPKNDQIPYVVYMIAESYYQQIPDTFDRDLEAAVEAIKYYRELELRYPGAPQIKEGRKKMKQAQEMLQNKQKYIADFYFKTEVYSAARWRYLDILQSFKDEDLRIHSMKRIIQSSLLLKEYENCIEYGEKFRPYFTKEVKSEVGKMISKCESKNVKIVEN